MFPLKIEDGDNDHIPLKIGRSLSVGVNEWSYKCAFTNEFSLGFFKHPYHCSQCFVLANCWVPWQKKWNHLQLQVKTGA